MRFPAFLTALTFGLVAFVGLRGGASAEVPAPVRIGLSAPLTGPDAAFGQGLRIGAEQAVADLNRAGPRRYALTTADDSGEPRQAAAVAARFAADNFAFVVGPFESSAVAAAAPVYARSGTVFMTPGATYGSLTGRGLWNLFRLGPSDPQQARAAADYLARTFADRPIAVVNDRTGFGRAMADAAAERLRSLGQREAVADSFDRGSVDLTALVRRLAEAKVEAVYFGGMAPDAATLVRALREAHLGATLVAGDGLLDPAFATVGAPGEGTVMTAPPEAPRLPVPPNGKVQPLTPEGATVAASAYAAVQILAQALERGASPDPRTGRVDGRKLAQALRAGPFRTLVGPVAFDAQGDESDDRVVALRVWRRQPDGRLDFAGPALPVSPRPN
ncbi:branched-chain amino acid ABC transporter substrate-binding protein [Methylobacterium aerolatum]|uniref:Branched-chain amino acid transport system substrate-binding protein n=1 Tax=Methylobacterium aerolatum TaxID=418708 RepID=A0ABU0I1R6_9HYPH|nr:branched-chain amino acid ABC transporter substrate-binding protein [Methylobacterium aerolatum]MDQ0447656.1 branched-chain amino acid transport system substrate-binding protein [Methylobacterium aerolatum]GJD34756.1 Leu/Ile/Val-binding protein [Methylobacterium aerolatum]